MNCEEFGNMLDNYENLTDEEKLSMNEHAAQCADCRAELDFMLAIVAQLNALPEIEVPSDFGTKLNERLELEKPVGFGRFINSVRNNYKRYSTIAACLVLAVMVGTNVTTLMDKMESETDSRTVAENMISDSAAERNAEDSAKSDETMSDEAVIAETSAAEADKPSEPVKRPANFGVNAHSERNTEKMARHALSDTPIVAAVNPQENIAEAIISSAPEQREPERSPEPMMKGRMADENAEISVASADMGIMAMSDEPAQTPDSYTIARGVYRLPDPKIAEVEASSLLMSNDVLQISEIESTIAKGRYYIPADTGNIAIDSSNKLGVNGEDAQRAAEVIQQYADISDETYYVVNSEDIPSMLEHMDGEGIDYENNMENANGEKVSFKLVIE